MNECYGVNGIPGFLFSAGGLVESLPLAGIPGPSAWAYLSEHSGALATMDAVVRGIVDWPWNGAQAAPWDPSRPRPGLVNGATWRLGHRGRANVAFFDGRVAGLAWDQANPSHGLGGSPNIWTGTP